MIKNTKINVNMNEDTTENDSLPHGCGVFLALIVICFFAAVLINSGKSNVGKTSSKNYYITTKMHYTTSSSYSSYGSSSGSYSNSFSNKYGTPTTICAHTGCKNYIASSGDTNCCTTHSNKCLECHKYIDEDAAYCTDCLYKAAKQIKNGY